MLILLRCRTSFVRTLRYLIRILTVLNLPSIWNTTRDFLCIQAQLGRMKALPRETIAACPPSCGSLPEKARTSRPRAFAQESGGSLVALYGRAACRPRAPGERAGSHARSTGTRPAASSTPRAPRLRPTHRAPTRTHPTRTRCAPYPFEAYTTLSAAFSQAGSLKMRKPRCRSASHSPAAASPTESAPFGHAFTQ